MRNLGTDSLVRQPNRGCEHPPVLTRQPCRCLHLQVDNVDESWYCQPRQRAKCQVCCSNIHPHHPEAWVDIPLTYDSCWGEESSHLETHSQSCFLQHLSSRLHLNMSKCHLSKETQFQPHFFLKRLPHTFFLPSIIFSAYSASSTSNGHRQRQKPWLTPNPQNPKPPRPQNPSWNHKCEIHK